MADSTDIIDVYPEDEEREYQDLIRKLNSVAPPVSSEGFDFSQIRGKFSGRTAKAMVLHLSCHGWSMVEIAEAFEVRVGVVSRYLSEAISEAVPFEDVEVLRAFELMKLDAMEKEVWKQFYRSCEDGVTLVESESEKGPGSSKTTRGQSGNPAYMRALIDIAKQRDKLLGLARPVKVDIKRQEQKHEIHEIVVHNRQEVEEARKAGLLK